jgi:NRPS condensation-like uncharacterized protein
MVRKVVVPSNPLGTKTYGTCVTLKQTISKREAILSVLKFSTQMISMPYVSLWCLYCGQCFSWEKRKLLTWILEHFLLKNRGILLIIKKIAQTYPNLYADDARQGSLRWWWSLKQFYFLSTIRKKQNCLSGFWSIFLY